MKRLISIGLAGTFLATLTVTACSSGDARLGTGSSTTDTASGSNAGNSSQNGSGNAGSGSGNSSNSTNGGSASGSGNSGDVSNGSASGSTAVSGSASSGKGSSSSSSASNGSADAGACCPTGWLQHDCVYADGGRGIACHDPAVQCLSSNFCGQGCDVVAPDSCGAADAGSDAGLLCNVQCLSGTRCCPGGAVGTLVCVAPLANGACPALP
jgi:hypothetical protein